MYIHKGFESSIQTYIHVHVDVDVVYIFVCRCLATKVFIRLIAGYWMGGADCEVAK